MFPHTSRRTVVHAFALLALFHSATRAGETEWPQFRGPTGQGLSAAVQGPVAWSATEHVAWKVEIPGRGWSSPVLSRGRLYLTAAVGEAAKTLHALCLDAKDGHTLWDTEIFTPEPAAASAMHRKNSLASPTPIVTADRLYVHFGHMGTAALDRVTRSTRFSTRKTPSPSSGQSAPRHPWSSSSALKSWPTFAAR